MSGQRVLLTVSAPTGTTTVAAVIGDPIAHSLSPVLHNAAFVEAGLDWVFVALPVAAGGGHGAVEAMRALGIAGMSVTMPHKESVVGAVDDLTPIARQLGAVNCIYRDGDRLVGDNTDGAGLLWALTDHLGLELAGRSVAVLGAGGAARAAISVLAGAGVSDLVVINRSSDRARAAAAMAGPVGRVGGLDDLDGRDLVVNATSVGMAGGAQGDPTDGADWAAAAVMDLIYHPAETELLRSARERGATVCNGVPMLIGQAAAAFERWTGVAAPLDAMTAAAAGLGLT